MSKSDKADELKTLMPDGGVVIDGEFVAIRQYGFFEGMQAGAIAGPLVDDLDRVFNEPGQQIGIDALHEAFAGNPETVIQLIAMAVDKPYEWVHGLSDGDGQTLLMAWWAANKDFFIRRLVQKVAERQVRQSAGEKSAPG